MQAGLVRGQSAVINIGKVLMVLYRAYQLPIRNKSPALVTLDAEKAFDNVKWSWLFQVLSTMGFHIAFQSFLS